MENANKLEMYDTFDFRTMLKAAFIESFTRHPIVSSFCHSGIFPLDAMRLIFGPRSLTAHDFSNVLKVNQVVKVLEEKLYVKISYVRGEGCRILSNGYLVTAQGAVLTSQVATELVRKKAIDDAKKRRGN